MAGRLIHIVPGLVRLLFLVVQFVWLFASEVVSVRKSFGTLEPITYLGK
ncbi:MAG: hypothetical protein Kow0088_26740 [Anaerolineales bacterium]